MKNAPATFQKAARYQKLGSAHTLILNAESGFAYPVGSYGGEETCGGGLHMIDVRTPTQPTFAGCYSPGYIHDGECVLYRGPDRRYKGREICLAAVPGKGVDIVDVTDKQRLKTIGTVTYPNAVYPHQGWLTDDQRYFFLDDEGDEIASVGPTTKTRTIHNLYHGRYMYQ